MREYVNLNSPSYLPSLHAGGSARTSLLASLYSQQNAEETRVNPLTALDQALADEARQVALTAADPQVLRDMAAFTQALAAARTPERLLANPTALRILLTAAALGDQVDNAPLAARTLLSNPLEANALVNRLPDKRWLRACQTYAFAAHGLSALNTPSAIDAIATAYARVLWRRTLDRTVPGLANALDFLDRGATIRTVWQVLDDPTFRAVITAVLDIPRQIAFQPLDIQEAAITTRVDLTRFQDFTFVKQFARRYLAAAGESVAGGVRALAV